MYNHNHWFTCSSELRKKPAPSSYFFNQRYIVNSNSHLQFLWMHSKCSIYCHYNSSYLFSFNSNDFCKSISKLTRRFSLITDACKCRNMMMVWPLCLQMNWLLHLISPYCNWSSLLWPTLQIGTTITEMAMQWKRVASLFYYPNRNKGYYGVVWRYFLLFIHKPSRKKIHGRKCYNSVATMKAWNYNYLQIPS